jgi:hypothetical protein
MTLAQVELLVPCVIAAFVLAAVIGGVILAHRAEQRRRAEFQAVAAELGFAYDPSSDPGFDDRFPRFECFHRGHSRRAFNLLVGVRGAPERPRRCTLGEFEFKETQGSGKNRRTVTYRFGFAVLETAFRAMPDILVREEHFFDKVAGFLGFDDIDFESAAFSRRFMVKSSDKRFAYDLIDAQMMEFLLEEGTPNIDIGDHAVCLWYGQSTRLEPGQLVELLAWGERFLERWPRVLVAELAERNAAPPPRPGGH